MSWTEVKTREGIPYGGMPYESILWRMEETVPAPTGDAENYAAEYADGDDSGDEDGLGYGGYGGYVRAEIIDRAPDTYLFESDQQRRDPTGSRSQINLRYNGNRGAYSDLPRHEELFIGFMGNDPRGAVNDPLLNQMRGQMDARAENLTVRMGDNDANHVAERPWANQSISYGMKELQRRVKKNTKIFQMSKEGRPWGSNATVDSLKFGQFHGAARTEALASGVEGLTDPALFLAAALESPRESLTAALGEDRVEELRSLLVEIQALHDPGDAG